MNKWIDLLSEKQKTETQLPVIYHLIDNPYSLETSADEKISVKKIEISQLNTSKTLSNHFHKHISRL